MTLTTRFADLSETQNASSNDWTGKNFDFLTDTRPTGRKPEMTWKKATGMNNKG